MCNTHRDTRSLKPNGESPMANFSTCFRCKKPRIFRKKHGGIHQETCQPFSWWFIWGFNSFNSWVNIIKEPWVTPESKISWNTAVPPFGFSGLCTPKMRYPFNKKSNKNTHKLSNPKKRNKCQNTLIQKWKKHLQKIETTKSNVSKKSKQFQTIPNKQKQHKKRKNQETTKTPPNKNKTKRKHSEQSKPMKQITLMTTKYLEWHGINPGVSR